MEQLTIKEALEKILRENPEMSKYRLSRILEKSNQSAIDQWIERDTVVPQLKTAKLFYKHFGILLSPFMESEVKDV